MTLTKADIAKKIADDCGFMKGEATEIVEKLLDIIKARLIEGEDVMISRLRKMDREGQTLAARPKPPNRGRINP